MTKIAVTGHKGRLGSELVSRGIQPLDCDITSKTSIKAALQGIEPDVVIHCAAMTDVDACEEFKTEAVEINAKGTENLKICFDGKIIYLSTDYIFDGKKGMYKEEDVPGCPEKISWYGYTKLLGEQVMGENDTIIRTTILYGSPMKDDFVTHILQKLELNLPFDVTRALYGTPTYVPHLADGIMALLKLPEMPHIINIAGTSIWSRYDLALTIASVFGCEDKKYLIHPTMKIGKVKRPKHAGLDVHKAIELGIPVHPTMDGF
jgi:dTDP-4-dehydrorhamnose reductase